MRHSRKHYQAAFTIVELLIVIVVIAILAAISTVAYSGIQNRARETRRQNDMTAIAKAITAYDIANEGVPRTFSYTNISTSGGWDYSLNPDWLSFLRASHGTMPVDPVNKAGLNGDPGSTNSRQYMYYCYQQGLSFSPDPSKHMVTIGYTNDGNIGYRKSFEVSRCI